MNSDFQAGQALQPMIEAIEAGAFGWLMPFDRDCRRILLG